MTFYFALFTICWAGFELKLFFRCGLESKEYFSFHDDDNVSGRVGLRPKDVYFADL